MKYPHNKYDSVNYEQIGRVIYGYSGDSLADAQQLTRRLLVNVLLANGDAHLKLELGLSRSGNAKAEPGL